MTTITWVIERMTASTTEINGFTEVVLTAGWRCNGTDGTYNATVYGSVGFLQPETGGSFTPYADLTQNQVLSWCWNNGVDKDATEKNVISQVESQANPPFVSLPLPWNN
jgi:hypothetical protein